MLQVQSFAVVARAAEESILGIVSNYGVCDVSGSVVQAPSDIIERMKRQEYVLTELAGYPGCLKVTVCFGRPPPKLLSRRASCDGIGCLRII